jgi:hypothetical protein
LNKELTDKLVADFPILFGATEPTTFSRYQFECDDGWEPLLRRLSEKVEEWNREQPLMNPESEPVRVMQVKEKFGGLRFYVGRCPEYLDRAIQEAEAESLWTCEDCGLVDESVETSTGKDRGWIRTLCQKCREVWEEKRQVSGANPW